MEALALVDLQQAGPPPWVLASSLSLLVSARRSRASNLLSVGALSFCCPRSNSRIL